MLPAISDVGKDENLSQPEFNNNAHSKCLIARDIEAIGMFFEKRERPETRMETPAEDNMTIVDIDWSGDDWENLSST